MLAREDKPDMEEVLAREGPEGSSSGEEQITGVLSQESQEWSLRPVFTPASLHDDDRGLASGERDEPDGAIDEQQLEPLSCSTAKCPTLQLKLKEGQDEDTPKVSPRHSIIPPLPGEAPSLTSNLDVRAAGQGDTTPQPSPQLSRYASSPSYRLECIQHRPQSSSPDEPSKPGSLNIDCIPNPPPAPTPESLSKF